MHDFCEAVNNVLSASKVLSKAQALLHSRRHIITHVLRIKPKIVKCASLIQSTLHIIKDDDSTELLHICPLALPQSKLFHQGLCKIIAKVFRSYRILAKISIVIYGRVII